MKKTLLLLAVSIFCHGYSQTNKTWKTTERQITEISKNAQRVSFPTDFKLFDLNLSSFRKILLTGQNQKQILISLPNAEGKLERFRMVEHSNFDAELQAQYPQIRSYAGVGIDDVYAQVRLSIDPRGVQTNQLQSRKETSSWNRIQLTVKRMRYSTPAETKDNCLLPAPRKTTL